MGNTPLDAERAQSLKAIADEWLAARQNQAEEEKTFVATVRERLHKLGLPETAEWVVRNRPPYWNDSMYATCRIFPVFTDDPIYLAGMADADRRIEKAHAAIFSANPNGALAYLDFEHANAIDTVATEEAREAARQKALDVLYTPPPLPPPSPDWWRGEVPAAVPDSLTALREYVARGLDFSRRSPDQLRWYALRDARDILENSHRLLTEPPIGPVVPRPEWPQGVSTADADAVARGLAELLRFLDEKITVAYPPKHKATNDNEGDTPKKSTRKWTAEAEDCLRLLKAARRKDPDVTLESVIQEWVDAAKPGQVRSFDGMRRRFNDHPDKWKPRKGDKKATTHKMSP